MGCNTRCCRCEERDDVPETWEGHDARPRDRTPIQSSDYWTRPHWLDLVKAGTDK